MATLGQDLQWAFRGLRRDANVSVLTTLSLGLAIAGNVAVFSLINGILYRPLPYNEPHRVAVIGEREESQTPTLLASPANFVDWKRRAQVFEALAGFRVVPLAMRGEEEAEQLTGAEISPSFLPLLGARPAHGRGFVAEEEVPGRDKVAILSHQLWQRRFSGDPSVIDQTVSVNDERRTVIGVMPQDFDFMNPNIEVWLPLALPETGLSRSQRNLTAVGRLRSGVTMAQAKAEMAKIADELAKEYPESNRGYVVDVLNLRTEVPDTRTRQLLGLLQGAVIFVLFIACANIANLLLARSQGRQREIAMRAILGAGRWRIIRQLLIESVVLAGCGGIFGLLLGAVGIHAMGAALAAVIPRTYAPVLDLRVLGFTVAVTLSAGLVFGLTPSLQGLRPNLVGTIKEGGRSGAGTSRRSLLSKSLVVAEIALSLVLLGGAGVLMRSFLEQQTAHPGFEIGNLLTVPVTVPADTYASDPAVVTLLDTLLEELVGLPEVSHATATNSLPQNVFSPTDQYSVDERPLAGEEQLPSAIWLTTPPSYLETMKIPLLDGRFFTNLDGLETEPVVAINHAMAQRQWPEGNAVGRRVTVLGESRRVIGIVGNVRQSALRRGQSSQETVYVPSPQYSLRNMTLILRTQVEPASVQEAVRQKIRTVAPDLVLGSPQTLEDFVNQFFVGIQIFNVVLGGFGTLALLLAALGTYGVLAYSVAQRTHEFGVRMAVGAGRSQVLWMVARQGMILAAAGLGLGAPALFGVSRLIAGLVIDAASLDLWMVASVAGVLLLVTLAASLLPARRAAYVEPVLALRYE